MKCSSFLKMCIAAGTVLTIPFSSLAKLNEANRNNKPFKVDGGKDRFDKAITLFEGDTFYNKVSTKDTDGDLYIYESTCLQKGGSALQSKSRRQCVWSERHFPSVCQNKRRKRKITYDVSASRKMEEFFIASSEGKLAKMPLGEQHDFRKQHGFERVRPGLDYKKTP